MIAYLIAAGALLVPAAFFLLADAPEGGDLYVPPRGLRPGEPPGARLLPPEPCPGIRFRWWHALVAWALFFGLQGFAAAAYVGVTGDWRFRNVLALLALSAAAGLTLTGIVAAAARLLYGSVRRGLGLRLPGKLREWLWVPFGLALAYAVTASYDMLLRLYDMQFEQALALQLQGLRGAGSWIAVMLCGGLLVPVAEEVVFRGCMYPGFKKSLGSFWAAVLSSLAFMIVHGELIAFPPIFIIGMITAYVYERTRSLYVPIAVHAVNNLIGLTVVALS